MPDITGVWQLVAEMAHDADGAPAPLLYGGAPLGSASFTPDGCFAAVLCDGRPAGDQPARAMLGFSGRYSMAGNQLTLLPDAASRPQMVGVPQTREVSLAGDDLQLTSRSPEGAVRRFTWRRLLPAS